MNPTAEQITGLRDPEEVMTLACMGAAFPTRISFMRCLTRRMRSENWRFERLTFDVDDDGFGTSVYAAHTPERTYSLVAFTNDLDPESRTDRVIATAWDATFNLFDGVPTQDDIQRLSGNTPKQEAGRFQASELCLARANKSLRLFEHVVTRLADGQQPDMEMLADVGYLMRTTAVYGSGKFGCGPREKIASRPETMGPFQAEMLAVFLIRWFTIDLVEHVARRRGGDKAVALDPDIKRFLGIGNSTGLGMAPFLVRYPILVNNWVKAREEALKRVRALKMAGPETTTEFARNLDVICQHVDEWSVPDEIQTARIETLRQDLQKLKDVISSSEFENDHPWDRLYKYGEENMSPEGQEILVSMILEPHGDLIDDLGDQMHASESPKLNPAMVLSELQGLISRHYAWALTTDYDDPKAQQNFWYYSEDKLEPRFSDRYDVPGAELEMPLAVGRDVKNLAAALDGGSANMTVAEFVRINSEFRHVVRRVQTIAEFPYGEIYDNLVGATVRPIDLLRFKLAFFGASKFDPKSDRWTRITMYQGAPMPDEITDMAYDNWTFPIIPEGCS
jgi:hypothetical protein